MPVYNTSNYGYLGKGYNSPIVGKHNSGREFKIHLQVTVRSMILAQTR